MAGDPGTFLAQRFLGDLDDDFLARLEQLADLLRTARNRLRPAPVGPEAPPTRVTAVSGVVPSAGASASSSAASSPASLNASACRTSARVSVRADASSGDSSPGAVPPAPAAASTVGSPGSAGSVRSGFGFGDAFEELFGGRTRLGLRGDLEFGFRGSGFTAFEFFDGGRSGFGWFLAWQSRLAGGFARDRLTGSGGFLGWSCFWRLDLVAVFRKRFARQDHRDVALRRSGARRGEFRRGQMPTAVAHPAAIGSWPGLPVAFGSRRGGLAGCRRNLRCR